MLEPRKWEIVERIFTDHAEALSYCDDHVCATFPRKSGDDWQVFEIVESK